MLEIFNQVEIALIIVGIFMDIALVLLCYKWKLDVISKVNEFVSMVADKYKNDKQDNLSDISEALLKLSHVWNTQSRKSPREAQSLDYSSEDDIDSALDDLFRRYS